MEITVTYKGHTEVTEGVSKAGNSYRKTTAIFETSGDYPKTIAFNVMNADIQRLDELQQGRPYKVNFNLQSREYNGKWYTDAKAWAILDVEQPAPAAQQKKAPQAVQTSIDTLPPIGTDSDDLPF